MLHLNLLFSNQGQEFAFKLSFLKLRNGDSFVCFDHTFKIKEKLN